jgi:putative ABC transport system permease protein
MRTLWEDLRYGVRALLKNPGFSLIAILTLALGIGANTAIFTVVNAALLRGLPYREPERLVHLWEGTPQKEFPRREASYPDFLDWRQNQSFESMAAYTGGGFTLTGRDAPERIQGARGSADFFKTLGVEPILGRAFQPGEDQPGAANVVLLSYGLWQRRFGGDSSIVGQSLTLNDSPYTVIGVLPPNFQFAPRGGAEMWTPFAPSEAQLSRRYLHGTNVIARLKPEISTQQATAEMSVIGGRIAAQHAESHTGTSIQIVPLQEEIVGSVKPILLALLCAVWFVLLIVCANVAGLTLVRAAGRAPEIAIRMALGATRARVARQLLTESVALSLIGGAAGLLLARWGVDALVAAIPEARLGAMPYLRNLNLDGSILAFTAALSLGAGIVFGLAPAFQATRRELSESLRAGGKSAIVTRQRLRNGLVVTEIALALVLLIGAGLMTKSLMRLLTVDPGFKTENLFMMAVVLPAAKYAEGGKVAAFHQQLIARMEALPGVQGAATVGTLPLVGGNTTRFFVEGEPLPPPDQLIEANIRDVSAGYFRTMGIPLISGRPFNDRDNATAPRAVIVNQTLARRVFPNASNSEVVGRRVIFSGSDRTPNEIVGVVGDEKVNGLDARTTPVVYYPFLQAPSPFTNLIVRAPNASTLAAAIRKEGLALEPGLTFFGGWTMERLMENLPATFARRYPTYLIGIFAVIALALAAIGIYGVISYSVSQRTREIGVRMALGARRRDVLTLVLKQGMTLTVTGVAIGLVVAFGLTRLMSNLLFSVDASDPTTFAAIVGVLLAVALVACYLPARKAAKVDPMIALRSE